MNHDMGSFPFRHDGVPPVIIHFILGFSELPELNDPQKIGTPMAYETPMAFIPYESTIWAIWGYPYDCGWFFLVENPNLKWMMTGGAPMTKRKSQYVSYKTSLTLSLVLYTYIPPGCFIGIEVEGSPLYSNYTASYLIALFYKLRMAHYIPYDYNIL